MLLHIILCLSTFPFAMALGALQGSNMNNIAKPNCPTHCGNVEVPYPFGIGSDTGCALDNSFHVTCDMSDETPKLFLLSSNIEIFSFSDSEFRIRTWPASRCYYSNGTMRSEFKWWSQLVSPFTFSEKNKLTVLGCDDYSLIRGTKGTDFSSGCLGLCGRPQDVPDDGQCSGSGCCQTSIPKGLNYYNVTLNAFQNHTDVWSFNRCGLAFLGEGGSFVFGGSKDLSNVTEARKRIRDTVLVVVDWVIAPQGGCSESAECKENSSCYEVDSGGYHCRCNNGYGGNPYLDPGCQGQLPLYPNIVFIASNITSLLRMLGYLNDVC
ncbi:putative EGF-like domain, wall-associated receptor kinase [Helianthus debilis subsp. tardiflorus]